MTAEARAITVDADPLRLVVPRSAWTLDGFRAWVKSDAFPEGSRATWIEGEVLVEMSPEAIDTHNTVKTELIVALGVIVRDEQLGELYADGVLYTNEKAGVSTEPDLVFASFEAIEKGRVRFVPKASRPDDRLELHGAPDLVVEVVSDSSERKDEELLRRGYARAGVPEYWVIDARGEQLRFELLVLDGEAYRPAAQSAVFGRGFRLERSRNRIGRWSYRLRIAE